MSTTSDFADFVTEQMAGAGNITKRKMMGEYVVYCQEKVIALICDNRLFIKPTSAGRVIMQKSLENKPDPMLEKTSLEITTGNIFEVPPFTGSKCWFMVEDKLEDRDFLAQLIKASYPELPMPKPKKKKAKATPKQRQSNAKATPKPNVVSFHHIFTFVSYI